MVLDLALIGLAITLDPLSLTAFIVVLPSQRGVREGTAFVFGLASASYLFMEIYAVFRPGQSQTLLARFRTWIDTPHRPGGHLGELDPGLLAQRQQPLPDPHLRHPQISMELNLGRCGEQTGRR